MVSLMDRLLKLENLDLHLTPYNVLATGQDEGLLEFIPSRSLAQVLCHLNDGFLDWKSALLHTISVHFFFFCINDRLTNHYKHYCSVINQCKYKVGPLHENPIEIFIQSINICCAVDLLRSVKF